MRGLETKVAALNVQVEDLKQEVLELEAAKSKLQSLVVTKTREHATQVSNFQLEENILREKCFALESDLNRWIKHDKAQQENMADLEHRIDDMNKQIKDLKNQIHQDNKQIIALEEVKKTVTEKFQMHRSLTLPAAYGRDERVLQASSQPAVRGNTS